MKISRPDNGTSNTLQFRYDGESSLTQAILLCSLLTFLCLAAPVISSMQPLTGNTLGNDRITLTGSNFGANARTVSLGLPSAKSPLPASLMRLCVLSGPVQRPAHHRRCLSGAHAHAARRDHTAVRLAAASNTVVAALPLADSWCVCVCSGVGVSIPVTVTVAGRTSAAAS